MQIQCVVHVLYYDELISIDLSTQGNFCRTIESNIGSVIKTLGQLLNSYGDFQASLRTLC